jgi:hypothetical protein
MAGYYLKTDHRVSFHVPIQYPRSPYNAIAHKFCKACPSAGGALMVLGGRGSCFYEGHTYFERNMDARQHIYFRRHFAWLKHFTYQSVSILAPKYKQHILSPAKVSYLFFSQHRLIKIKWHCCRSSYYFRIIMPVKGINAPWALY